MNHRLWLAVICLTTCACTEPAFETGKDTQKATAPAQASAGASAAKSTDASAPATAASRIYIDPDTGQPRAPTPAELAAEAAPRKQINAASSASSTAVKVTPLPGGFTEYDLGDAARVEETACLQADGSLGECTAQQKQELRERAQQHRK